MFSRPMKITRWLSFSSACFSFFLILISVFVSVRSPSLYIYFRFHFSINISIFSLYFYPFDIISIPSFLSLSNNCTETQTNLPQVSNKAIWSFYHLKLKVKWSSKFAFLSSYHAFSHNYLSANLFDFLNVRKHAFNVLP